MAHKYFKSVKTISKASNWSRENTIITAQSPTVANQTFGTNIIPASPTQGKRTVGNFCITLTPGMAGTNAIGVFWALVYVPQGQTTASLNITDGQSIYEPNQYVIACGYSDGEAGPIRIRTSMKRKLNSGDFVSLLMASAGTGVSFKGVVSYSVKYN